MARRAGFPMKVSAGLRFGFSFAPSRLCVRLILAKAKSRKVRFLIATLVLALVSLSAFFVHSYRSYAKIVDGRLAHGYLTSRAGIYAAPRTLRVEQKISPAELAAALRRAGYVESDEASEVWNGSFSVADASVHIRPNNNGGYPAVVQGTFDPAGRIIALTRDEISLDSFTLPPDSLST